MRELQSKDLDAGIHFTHQQDLIITEIGKVIPIGEIAMGIGKK